MKVEVTVAVSGGQKEALVVAADARELFTGRIPEVENDAVEVAASDGGSRQRF